MSIHSEYPINRNRNHKRNHKLAVFYLCNELSSSLSTGSKNWILNGFKIEPYHYLLHTHRRIMVQGSLLYFKVFWIVFALCFTIILYIDFLKNLGNKALEVKAFALNVAVSLGEKDYFLFIYLLYTACNRPKAPIGW